MAIVRRGRGALLRLVRRRVASCVIGVLLAAPGAWMEWRGANVAWWIEGLGLVVGATGLALFWTGLTGVSPDWIEDES